MKKLIVAIAAFAMLTGSAYAADWNFYGNARIATFYSSDDNAADDSYQLSESLQGNSRIGATVKVSDELSGRFEYGASNGNANIRLLYGVWNFGSGKLTIGQDWTPMNLWGSNQVYAGDGALEGYGGEMFSWRAPQLKLTFGGFEIAVLSPRTDMLAGSADDVTIPQIQIAYNFSANNFALGFAGGYQTFDVVGGDDVTSWGMGVDASVNFAGLTAGAQINGGTNVGNLWYIDVTGTAAGNGYATVDAAGNVVDNDALGYRVYVAYKINDMIGVEAGYGYQQTEYDNADENESQSYYIQAPITLAAGVVVTPEVGVIDYKEAGEADTTYFGAKWQINF